MKILENLWQVGGQGLTAPSDAAIYLFRREKQAALIDAGCGNGHDKLIRNITACLPPDIKITHLLLTHCHFDHTGGAAAVRDHYGCKIVAHAKDAVFLEKGDSAVTAASWYDATLNPFRVDIKVNISPATIRVGNDSVVVYHCPGHSPGSLVYLVELESRKVLFGQDVHGPLDPSLFSNRRDYLNSLEFIQSLDADILCEGHYGIYQGKKRVKAFINSFITS